jgi:hypothetical protein
MAVNPDAGSERHRFALDLVAGVSGVPQAEAVVTWTRHPSKSSNAFWSATLPAHRHTHMAKPHAR